MNSSNVSTYPAALYSAVSEIGYRNERFTGEVLRSGLRRRGSHRRSRFAGLRVRTAPSVRPDTPRSQRRHLHRHVSAH
jgi:hypothetical protein